MADFPALPLWTDAYLADTRHLSRDEHGAYLLLLMEAWRRPSCRLPDDDAMLARLSCSSPEEWARLKPVVMAFWMLDKRSKEWRQKRLEKERRYVALQSQVQRDKALKRWGKTKTEDAAAMPEGMPDRCPLDAPTPTPTPIKKEITNSPVGTPPGVDQADLDTLFYQRGKALLGRNAGGQLTKLRAAVGLGAALEVIDQAQHKDSPAEYVAGSIRNHRTAGNGRGKREDWYGRRILERAARELAEAEAAEAEPCASGPLVEGRAQIGRG